MTQLSPSRKLIALFTIFLLFVSLQVQSQSLKPVAQKISDLKSERQVFTPVNLFSIAAENQQRSASLVSFVSKSTILALGNEVSLNLITSKPQTVSFKIPIDNSAELELELYQANLFTPDFAVTTSAGNGNAVPYTGGIHYQGIIKGDVNSIAAISVYDGEVMGLISSNVYGNLVLGKLENDPANRHILYSDKDLLARPAMDCFTQDDNQRYDQNDLRGPLLPSIQANCIRVYWEVNVDIYNNKGSVGNAANYVIGLFNQSNVIYANDGILISLSELYVWNTASPYTGSSTSSLLGQFQSYRNSFNGNLGHLIGYAGGGGVAAGFNGLCNSNIDNSQCYSGISSTYQTVPTYSWSVMVVTHEQGHLLGSRHTHACVWNGNNTAIDNCAPTAGYGYEGTCSGAPSPGSAGGTIMSYCHLVSGVGINFNNGFGSQPRNVILTRYSNATCLTACSGTSSTTAITTSNVTSTMCAGQSVNVSYAVNGPAVSGNVFTAQLSNSAGSFTTPTSIGTLTSVNSGTISCVIPGNTTTGTGYRIRVVSSNPVVTGSSNASNLSINATIGTGVINGSSSVCQSTTENYSTSITNATVYNWAVPSGSSITAGAGTANITVSFSSFAVSGNITVYGSNGTCSGPTSSKFVSVGSGSISLQTVTGGGSYCSGGAGVPVGLAGSQIGVDYQLNRNSIPVGSPVAGTGSAISFGNQTSAGTYTVTGSDGAGCASSMSNSVSVTINPLPTVTANNVSGCDGNAIALSGSPSSGTWSVANPYVGPSTTYTHSYTDGNGCSNTSAPATITVNPLPVVTANDVSGCAGSAIALSGTPTGGTWSVSNPYIGTSSTTYTHSYTDGNGCSNTSATANITVLPAPSVSFTGLASSYDLNAPAVTLTGSPLGGTFSGPGISGNTFTPSAAGVGGPYTITYSYTDGNGCSGTASHQTTVTSCTAPAQPGIIAVSGGSAKVCPGDTRTYTIASVAGATSYSWTAPTGGNIVSGQGSTSVTINYTTAFTTNGNISVVANGPCGISPARTLLIQRKPRCNGARPELLAENVLATLNLYPNPAHESIDVKFYSEVGTSFSIRLSDYVGKTVYSFTGISAEGDNIQHINLTSLAKGIYFLQLQYDNEKVTKKVIIE
jgi:hypothetical protein